MMGLCAEKEKNEQLEARVTVLEQEVGVPIDET